jgi:hypothetical protein
MKKECLDQSSGRYLADRRAVRPRVQQDGRGFERRDLRHRDDYYRRCDPSSAPPCADGPRYAAATRSCRSRASRCLLSSTMQSNDCQRSRLAGSPKYRRRRSALGSRFAADVTSRDIVAQPDERRMTQPRVLRPFSKRDLGDHLRLHPDHCGHVCSRNPLPPMTRLGVR